MKMTMRNTVTGVALALSVLLAGCDPQGTEASGSSEPNKNRSVETFCETVAKHKDRYLETMAGADTTDGLLNLLRAVSAVGDLRSMWTDLAATAPADISSDAQAVSEGWNSSTAAVISRDYAGVIATALLTNGAASRLNSYIAEKCGTEYAPIGTGFDGLEAPDPRGQPVLVSGDFEADFGYMFHIELSGADIEPTVDVANSVPGKALYSFVARGTGRLTNTTADRNAPVPTDMQVNVLWKAGSPVCDFLGESDNADIGGYCGRAWALDASTATLGPEESVELTWALGTITPRNIEEGADEHLTELIRNPDGWAFELEGRSLASAASLCLGSEGIC